MHFEHVPVNVYDIKTKEIVFTGSQTDAAKFIGVPKNYLCYYLKTKAKVKKKWAIRYAKPPQ